MSKRKEVLKSITVKDEAYIRDGLSVFTVECEFADYIDVSVVYAKDELDAYVSTLNLMKARGYETA